MQNEDYSDDRWVSAGDDHEMAIDGADELRRQVGTEDVIALAAITITSDGHVALHQPHEQVADEPLVVFALIGAMKAMADNLTQMLKKAEVRKCKREADPALN